MERNFTYERKSEIRDFIEASLNRWIQLDLEIESTSNFLSVLGFRNITGFADTYRGRVVQKLKTDLEILEEKYKDARHIEKMYSTKHIAEARQSIQSLNEYIMRLAEMISYKNGDIDVSKAAFISLMWNSYESKFEKMQQNREFAYDVESIVYDVYGIRKNVNDVGIASQKYVVEAYELIHPEIKAKMDKFLSTGEPNVLTENDITSIKYLAYTAPEPYRTVYLECVGTYEIGYISEEKISSKKSGARFSSSDNKIYMENTSEFLRENPRGAYTTFFHESGHATDYNLCLNKYFSLEYSTNKSRFQEIMDATNTTDATLQKAIYCDVYNGIEKQIIKEIMELTKEEKEYVDVEKICGSFMYGSENIRLTKTEKDVRDKVIEYYNSNYHFEKDEAVSDLYGGVTNLIIFEDTGYRHDYTNFWGEYNYWYKQNGTSTQAQSKEFVAIYFSQQMTGDLEAINSTKEHFPQACELMEEMFRDIKQK